MVVSIVFLSDTQVKSHFLQLHVVSEGGCVCVCVCVFVFVCVCVCLVCLCHVSACLIHSLCLFFISHGVSFVCMSLKFA